MKIAEVYIEHDNLQLDRTFTYRCNNLNVKRGMRVKVPFGYKVLVGFVDQALEVSDSYEEEIGFEIKDILEVLDEEPLIHEELFELAKYMAKTYCATMISCFQCMLPAKLKPKTTSHRIKTEAWVVYKKEIDKLTKRQLEVLEIMKEIKEMRRTSFYASFKSVGKKLVELGCLEVIEKEASALFEDIEIKQQLFELTLDQKNAIASMQNTNEHKVYLLHGATGSGKTEVFLRMADKVLKEGKQVVFLVPEISLTPQMVNRVRKRFGSRVAIYHSGLNPQEKYEQYQAVKKHESQIVVGTRSAIFMPFDQLGLVIMDEEHENSYKQDSNPRYHCRDIALKRAQYHNCPLILASATPSLESYARAVKHVYQLVEMPNRINDSFPNVKMIEMRKAIGKGESFLVSDAMLDAIHERLQKKEQVILLLNRRGYTPILRCISCGYVQMCPSCDIAMTYHKEEQVLKCHTCGHTMNVPTHCPSCGNDRSWRYLGIGTQRLEEFIQLKFPQARILRMDADTTTKKHAHEQFLKTFHNHEADILIGTQMIAKGLDFENVTLVGILNGDAMLNRSDYRSSELTYDLLEQACGRSGRGSKKGEVIIQAYDTKHYAITCAAAHNYKSFFQQEMRYRHLAKYPPYMYLASIQFIHKKEDVVTNCAQDILPICKQEDVRVLGPAMLIKLRDEQRCRIILKSKNQNILQEIVSKIVKYNREYKQKARIEVDMQPIILE